ncbi:MAG TPA: TadE family protein [Candidatus Dormibacteraeota bacterium]|jgi:hypothetical protein|nr:TadE family protein [Candidatus Dormibacteraeota bacterium]
MLEFALVIPVLMLMLVGILELGLLSFVVGTVRFAAGEAARAEAQVGNGTTACNTIPGCTAVYGNNKGSCDADCQAIVAINNTALGSTNFERVSEIDITKLSSSGDFSADSCNCVNKYKMDGTAIGTGTYPTASRTIQYGSTDFLSVTIRYTHPWLTGIFNNLGTPQLSAVYYVRLEPQKF